MFTIATDVVVLPSNLRHCRARPMSCLRSDDDGQISPTKRRLLINKWIQNSPITGVSLSADDADPAGRWSAQYPGSGRSRRQSAVRNDSRPHLPFLPGAIRKGCSDVSKLTQVLHPMDRLASRSKI